MRHVADHRRQPALASRRGPGSGAAKSRQDCRWNRIEWCSILASAVPWSGHLLGGDFPGTTDCSPFQFLLDRLEDEFSPAADVN
jgi:hypothetical protein